MSLRRAFQICLLVMLAWPSIAVVPQWCMPTWVGCAWGALVLTGMISTWASHRLGWIAYAGLAMSLAQHGLMVTLAVAHHQAWLVVCSLVAAGWLIGKLTTFSTAADDRVAAEVTRWPQVSLWDLAVITTGVALLCWVVPRVEGFFYLACQLAPAISGGLLLSLLAAQWAWRDRWSLSSLAGALAVALVAMLLIVPYNTLDRQAIAALAIWMIAGPIGVIAAQGTLVLAYMATTRVSHCKTTALCTSTGGTSITVVSPS